MGCVPRAALPSTVAHALQVPPSDAPVVEGPEVTASREATSVDAPITARQALRIPVVVPADAVLHVYVDGAGLLDPVLNVVDAQGEGVAHNDDARGLDSQVAAPVSAGRYALQVAVYAGPDADARAVGSVRVVLWLTPPAAP